MASETRESTPTSTQNNNNNNNNRLDDSHRSRPWILVELLWLNFCGNPSLEGGDVPPPSALLHENLSPRFCLHCNRARSAVLW
jgi:hypothetical protein